MEEPAPPGSPSEIPLPKEKIKIRGLLRIAGGIFIAWGSWVGLLGIYHAFFGEPEANYYSLEKWQFVTQAKWLKWSGFEICYGLACAALGAALLDFSKRVPEWVEREKVRPGGPLPD